MKTKVFKYFLFVSVFIATENLQSQTCGFGCLGLSGVFGGYSIQQYEADGLNGYLNEIVHPSYLSSIASDEFDFKEGHGVKVGINLVRADYPNFFFTFKGFYQFLNEEQTIKIPDEYGYKYTYEASLKMDNWGIGLDLGIPFGSFVDWKIIDSELNFFSPKVYIKSGYNDPLANYSKLDNVYSPDEVKMGFSIGSGLIFNLIEDYISLEATGMFTFVEIDYLTNDVNGNTIPSKSESKLISKGGLQGNLRLNIGIPL